MKIVHLPRVFQCSYALSLALVSGGAGCVIGEAPAQDEALVSADITFTPGAAYTLVGVQSNKCIGVANAASGTRLDLETCAGTANQRFRPESMGGGFFRMRNELSGLCVDVSGASTADGAAVIEFACGTQTNQQWSFTDITGGSERVTARHSGKVLDVTGQATADGTLIEQWTSNNGGNQHFVMRQALAAISQPPMLGQ
jgi:hypothetical protein